MSLILVENALQACRVLALEVFARVPLLYSEPREGG